MTKSYQSGNPTPLLWLFLMTLSIMCTGDTSDPSKKNILGAKPHWIGIAPAQCLKFCKKSISYGHAVYLRYIAIVDGISYSKSIRHLKKLEWYWRGMLLL